MTHYSRDGNVLSYTYTLWLWLLLLITLRPPRRLASVKHLGTTNCHNAVPYRGIVRRLVRPRWDLHAVHRGERQRPVRIPLRAVGLHTRTHAALSNAHIPQSRKALLMAVRALDLFAHVREGRVAGHRGAPSVIRAVIEPKARPTPHFVLRSHTHTRRARARARPRARAKIKLHFRLPAITMESATARSAPGQSAARPHSPPAPAERARGCRVGLCSGSL